MTPTGITPAFVRQFDLVLVQGHTPRVLTGHSGPGDSHLLIAFGAMAAEAGLPRALHVGQQAFDELVEATDDKHLAKLINRYGALLRSSAKKVGICD